MLVAAHLLLLLHMIFENNDFGVGGNVNFFTEANFILMNTKITTLNQKIIPPPQKKKKKKNNNRNFLISTFNYQRYTKFTSIHMFLRMTKRMKYSKKEYASPQLSKSKMAANYGQRIVLGIKSINMPFLILP